jgi:hypothetical protein
MNAKSLTSPNPSATNSTAASTKANPGTTSAPGSISSSRSSLLGSESISKQNLYGWTKSPDIRAKLRIERDQTKFWYDYLRATIPEVAPFLPTDSGPFEEPDETLAPGHLPLI